MEEDVPASRAGLTVYPDPAEVFVADQQHLADHLHPVVSIDLSTVNPDWAGSLHVLSPVEPVEGFVGDVTTAFHGPLQAINWIGFAVEDGRYRMLGDVRYFADATTEPELPDPFPDFRKSLDEHCRSERDSFAERRALAIERGGPYSAGGWWGDPEPVNALDQLGGEVDGWGSWASEDFWPLAAGPDRDWPVVPLSPRGNRFVFVASADGSHFRQTGADSILLFYQPQEGLALLTFEWT